MRVLRKVGVCTATALILASAPPTSVDQQASGATERRMSFHNRLLLNRPVLAGLGSIEVLLLVEDAQGAGYGASQRRVTALVERLGGQVVKTEEAIGYMRVAVAPNRLVALATSRAIEAYQISSLSRGAWYRDGPPLANAQMYRQYEVTPVAATEPVESHPHLPVLTPAEARRPGFTADDDAGVGQWMADHPTYDGRGVTIAVLENALPAFADPVFRAAKTLDGRDVPKIAGIVNAIAPEHPDETRVLLDRVIESERAWAMVDNRTYVLPRPGRYRFGMLTVPAGGNVAHQFALVEEESTGEIRIDTNGDASFQDEPPLADVNERFDPKMLSLVHPRKAQVSFVMGRGERPHVVHIYLGRSRHQTMTASVAAGGRSNESLASGVAPGARLLFVRMNGSLDGTEKIVEGFIEAAKRPDVDVLSSSTGGLGLVPDTARDFAGLLFTRLTTTYGKPIVSGAGNFGAMLAHTFSHGSALSTGGMLGPATHEAFYGGRRLPGPIVHPWSASGPALDGGIKPDVLAPVERIAANPPWESNLQLVPLGAPTRRLPPGYEISCCTSASSPYLAGAVALLMSAAKQANVPYTAEGLMRTLRVTARPIPGVAAHRQGHGAIDIRAAWQELMQRRADPPRIVSSAAVVHPLAQYAATGPEGQGIFEIDGWTAGQTGTRDIRLRRETGPAEPITYTLRWRTADGTFRTAPSISLPLGGTVSLPVQIATRTAGAHSDMLTLHADTGAVVFRTLATVVAPHRPSGEGRAVEIKGAVELMRENAHYVGVPPGVGAMEVELDVTRGVVRQAITRAHGLISNYYPHVHPMEVFTIGAGRYHVLLPNPQPGIWAFRLKNASIRWPPGLGLGPRGDDEAEYALRVRLLSGTVRTPDNDVAVEVENSGGDLSEPVLEAWPATARTHRASFQANGLANAFDIHVPAEAATLLLDLRSAVTSELFLYDCTTGECFSYDVAFPANLSHRLVVRRPAPGRWVAAVNAAPFPTAGGSFTLDEVIATGEPLWRRTGAPLTTGRTWREAVDGLPAAAPAAEGRERVVLVELLDVAAERREEEQPWSSHPRFTRLRDRPVAIGTAILRPPNP